MLITNYLDGWGASVVEEHSVVAVDWLLFSLLSTCSSVVDEAFVVGVGVAGAGDAATEDIDEELHDWLDVLFLDSFGSFGSFGSFVCPFFGPRFFGGGAFAMQPWQYHLPRGTLFIGGM